MEAGAAPLITIAPNASLNFKTKGWLQPGSAPPLLSGLQGLNLSCVRWEKSQNSPNLIQLKLQLKMEVSLFGQEPEGLSFAAGFMCVSG